MLKVFDKLPAQPKPQFSMPLSLRLIKELSNTNINWKDYHIADLYSIIYAIRIEKAQTYLKYEKERKMHEKGISNISRATEEDFDKL